MQTTHYISITHKPTGKSITVPVQDKDFAKIKKEWTEFWENDLVDNEQYAISLYGFVIFDNIFYDNAMILVP